VHPYVISYFTSILDIMYCKRNIGRTPNETQKRVRTRPNPRVIVEKPPKQKVLSWGLSSGSAVSTTLEVAPKVGKSVA